MTKKTFGIIGASGHTAQELITLLQHKENKKYECVFLQSVSQAGENSKYQTDAISGIYKKYENLEIDEMIQRKPDIIFFATPHGVCMHSAEKFIKNNIKIIDLSGDFRFSNTEIFEKNYDLTHNNRKLNEDKKKCIYGLPEYFSKEIKNAQIIANPGCYVTASLLGSLPIKEHISEIIIDGKSGYSGAGREFSLHKEIEENAIIPYKIIQHRHEAEIQQFHSGTVYFTPHLINTYRGLLVTLHIKLTTNAFSENEIFEMYKEKYKNFPDVIIQKEIPRITEVQNTNKCIIGGFSIDDNNRLVIISTLDNLQKGASGQAIQNMKLLI